MRPIHPTRTRATLARTNEVNLPDRCDILKKVTTRQPGGVSETTYPLVHLNIPCYLFPASTLQKEDVGAQVVDAGDWYVRLKEGQEVFPEGRIQVTKAGTTLVLDVVGLLAPRSHETTRLVRCERVSP